MTANAIGDGLSALPGALVPYIGINQWVRLVIVLGAGVLLLDAALVLAFAPRALGDLRRAAAALPLVALAVVPSTLVRPRSALPAGSAAVRAARGVHVGRADPRTTMRDRDRGRRARGRRRR